MVKKKRLSKRISLSKKYRIEDRVKEHHKKMKKIAKKNPGLVAKKGNKDIGIPNLWPFKEKMMAEVEKAKAASKEQHQGQPANSEKVVNFGSMMKDVERRQAEFSGRQAKETTTEKEMQLNRNRQESDNSRRAFYKDFKSLVEKSDVLLEVLDVRDPLGCQSRSVEDWITSTWHDKRIVIVLNKIDLVPKANVELWLKYFRSHGRACIAFKASTQEQKTHLGFARNKDQVHRSECVGGDTLIELLKSYCKNKNIKTSIAVGVFGYPNVGKSSLINSLARSRVAEVGATPGVTRAIKEVVLDKHIRLLDSPGIVFDNEQTEKTVINSASILRNVIKVEQLSDPITPVAAILCRVPHDELVSRLEIEEFNPESVSEFLVAVANRRGKIKKGSLPDLDAAARTVLNDWNSGKIPYCSQPPVEDVTVLTSTPISSELVQELAAEFDIEKLTSLESNDMAVCTTEDVVTLEPEDGDEEMYDDSEDEGSEEEGMEVDE